MSKTNGKQNREAADTAQAATKAAVAAAAGSGPLAVVPAAPAPAPGASDEHHGQGGLYVMKDGRRVLAERTQQPSAA